MSEPSHQAISQRRRVSRRGCLAVAWALMCGSFGAPLIAAIPVIYMRPTADIDREASYPVELLELSLSKSGGDYALQPSFEPIPQARAIRLLQEGIDIDVIWTVTSPERERSLLPIRIPIDRGLYGWRLFLIHADAQPRFDQVQSIADLALLTAGQGHDWPDVQILRGGGLTVGTGSSYDGLFEMLARGRIDYFPRAIPEVTAELQQRHQLPLQLERGLVLHYPSALYFFVSPKNPGLARAIHDGLERAGIDGSFERLFERFFGESIRRAQLHERTILRIANPSMPSTPAQADPRFWFSPETPP